MPEMYAELLTDYAEHVRERLIDVDLSDPVGFTKRGHEPEPSCQGRGGGATGELPIVVA